MSKLRLKANGVVMDTPVADLEDMRTYDNAGVVVASFNKGKKRLNRVMRCYFDGPFVGQTKEELIAGVTQALHGCIVDNIFPEKKRGKPYEPSLDVFEYICIRERAKGSNFGFSYEYAEAFIDEYIRLLEKYRREGTLDPENNYDQWNVKSLSPADVLRGLVVVDPHYGVCSGPSDKPVFDKERMKELFGFDPTDPNGRLGKDNY